MGLKIRFRKPKKFKLKKLKLPKQKYKKSRKYKTEEDILLGNLKRKKLELAKRNKLRKLLT